MGWVILNDSRKNIWSLTEQIYSFFGGFVFFERKKITTLAENTLDKSHLNRRRCFYRQQYRHKRSWGDRSCYAVCKCNRCNNDVNQCRQRNYICCSSGQGGHREDLILPICWRTISKRLFLSSADTLTALRKILIYPSEIFILTTSLRKRMKSRSCAKNAQFQQARFLFDEAQ